MSLPTTKITPEKKSTKLIKTLANQLFQSMLKDIK